MSTAISETSAEPRHYSYLGPAGTFTEAALAQVPEARGQRWRSVHNVGEALADVVEGRSHAAMIAIENSVDGGVSTNNARQGGRGRRARSAYYTFTDAAVCYCRR